MLKSIWLSYDLGVKGDYTSLYAWLDNHNAVECGDSMAHFKWEVPQGESLPEKVKRELLASISFGKTDRVYIVWRTDEGHVKGRFIVGKRKAAPWQGYGDTATEDDL